MKKLLFTAAAILATLNIYAQGTGRGVVNFSNLGRPNDDRVWVNSSGAVGDGALADNRYSVALYSGPDGATDLLFTQMGNAAAFFPAGAAAGTFGGGNRTITGLTGDGDVASIQVRAWLTTAGNTWEAAALNPAGQVGKSAIFTIDTEPVGGTTPPPTVGLQAGFSGFSITPVPEPSVIGLGLLGVGALLMLRRRK
jgi:MYXO-CTERM domain-containing protein